MVRAKAEPEEESEEGDADGNLEEDEEKKAGKPSAADTSMLFSRRAANNALLNKLEKHYKKPKPAAVRQAQIPVPPDGQEHTENEGRPVSEIMERLSFIKKFI